MVKTRSRRSLLTRLEQLRTPCAFSGVLGVVESHRFFLSPRTYSSPPEPPPDESADAIPRLFANRSVIPGHSQAMELRLVMHVVRLYVPGVPSGRNGGKHLTLRAHESTTFQVLLGVSISQLQPCVQDVRASPSLCVVKYDSWGTPTSKFSLMKFNVFSI